MQYRSSVAGFALAAVASFVPLTSVIAAEAVATATYNLPAQDLDTALAAVRRISGKNIVFDKESVEGRKSPPLVGDFTPEDAVNRLIEGSDLSIQSTKSAIVIRRVEKSTAAGGQVEMPEPIITVTGSHIRGGQTASPVASYEADALRAQGVADMRSLASVIPQNFTGGQNPGVATGAESFGSQNGNSSTQLNLRGLGPDATLTLLNGHRLVYDRGSQGVDISTIPFAAVDRVEIMPDGASALYGSDAVGGVANVILKHDYAGIAANATIGAATDGGYFNRDYSVVGGQKWGGGSGLIALGHQTNSPVNAGERSYTQNLQPDQTLFPRMTTYQALGSVVQSVGGLKLSADALYSHRDTSTNVAYTPTAPARDNGLVSETKSDSWTIAPSAEIGIGDWSVSLSGVHGESSSTSTSTYAVPGSAIRVDRTKYQNRTDQVEFALEGRLVSLPAGPLRIALGGGWRRNHLVAFRSGAETSGAQSSVYGYGEANLPIISEGHNAPLISRLTVTAAARYEKYDGVGDLITPKLGVVWTLTPGLSAKLSWGRSFKAPRISQLIQLQSVLLLPLSFFGVPPTTPGQTVLIGAGGNASLQPEKAKSLAVTVEAEPVAIPNLRLAATYYSVDYNNRIVQPLVSPTSALVDPVYADLVTLDPTAAFQNDLIARAGAPTNLTGRSYDPALVYAFIDARWTNTNREKVQGIDLAASYRMGDIALFANGTYLETTRKLTSTSATNSLAGCVFYPPHVRARGGGTWSLGDTTLSGVVNYVGPVTDRRFNRVDRVRSLTTVDFAAGRHLELGRGLGALDLRLSVANLLNAKPDIIRTASIYEVPYDSTNYSSLGRVISLSITKSW
jgi:outer membrane receptor protein involved in Fe transport